MSEHLAGVSAGVVHFALRTEGDRNACNDANPGPPSGVRSLGNARHHVDFRVRPSYVVTFETREGALPVDLRAKSARAARFGGVPRTMERWQGTFHPTLVDAIRSTTTW